MNSESKNVVTLSGFNGAAKMFAGVMYKHQYSKLFYIKHFQ